MKEYGILTKSKSFIIFKIIGRKKSYWAKNVGAKKSDLQIDS